MTDAISTAIYYWILATTGVVTVVAYILEQRLKKKISDGRKDTEAWTSRFLHLEIRTLRRRSVERDEEIKKELREYKKKNEEDLNIIVREIDMIMPKFERNKNLRKLAKEKKIKEFKREMDEIQRKIDSIENTGTIFGESILGKHEKDKAN